MNPQSSAALRFGQRSQLSGAPGTDLESLSTFELPDGCEVVVNEAPLTADIFILMKSSVFAADGINVIAPGPGQGPGRWFRYSFLNGDGSQLNAAPITFANPLTAPNLNSSPVPVVRRVTGKVLVQIQIDLLGVAADVVTVQGLVDGFSQGTVATYNLAMGVKQTVLYEFLATFAAPGLHSLTALVTPGTPMNVTADNALLFTTGAIA